MSPSVAKTNECAPTKTAAETVRQYAAGLQSFIKHNAEYVGPRFAEEARKIHYGEVDERHIYGESTTSEVKDLIEEGIEVAPFPVDPEEMN